MRSRAPSLAIGRSLLAAAVAALFLILAGTPALALEVVVMASNVDGIAPGQVLDGAESIEVPANGTLTLITADGRSITLTGPYSGAPAIASTAGDRALVAALSALLSGGEGAPALGVVRGTGGAGPDDPWLVDVTHSGDHCVRGTATARLWRPRADQVGVLSLRAVETGERVRADWNQGESTLAWPATVPLADGANYFARLNRGITARRLVLHVVPDGLATEAHRAVWMAQHGCVDQARSLLWGMAAR